MSSTNRGAIRRERDAYPTPAWCVEALVPEILWGEYPHILEPAFGDGAIAREIVEHIPGYVLDWCEIEKGRDFFELDATSRYDFVLTNPPFSLAKEFIDKARQVANCVIMLLPLGFYGSEERHEWWKANEPTAQHTLSRRPMFSKNKDGKWGTDSETYSWLVWDTTGRQKRGIFHLNPTDEQYKQSVAEFKRRYGGEAG